MRIVLVDASRVTLKLIGRMLTDNGHEVVCFSDGLEALAYLHGGSEIDLLMTSFETPGVPGIQLCWEARLIANGDRPLYVIAMSSSNDADHLAEALDSGADDFIRKPPAPMELDARLRAAERLNQARRELVRLATRDGLTGLLNRRAFFIQAEDLLRHGIVASVILLDIDHFKLVNDTYGHDGGDVVLTAVARAMSAYAGRAARVGGEEFAILLPGVTESDAYEEAERLRWRIADTAVTLRDGRTISVTASLGVAEHAADDNADEWMKRADIALYAAKTGGRNRTVMGEEVSDVDGRGSGLARSGGGRMRQHAE
ncbi:diguanylate cyclase [Azorhizobium caulinodans]|uniref:GGDEF domain-containing response regulator n=1 Tax=Azorhizobium caulinodans TaxID=7 RepID=UPI002FBF17DE